MEDWAETRAREFCNERWPSQRVEADDLAALLREVWEEGLKAGTTQEAEAEHRADSMLAEVRRVITASVDDLRHNAGLSPADMLNWNYKAAGAIWVRDEILSRLERL